MFDLELVSFLVLLALEIAAAEIAAAEIAAVEQAVELAAAAVVEDVQADPT